MTNMKHIAYTVWKDDYLTEWGLKWATKIKRFDAPVLFLVGICEKKIAYENNSQLFNNKLQEAVTYLQKWLACN